MRVEVVFLPHDLQARHLNGRTVVVFDVLRATTSICAALQVGIEEIHVFPDTTSARLARQAFSGNALLCGEERCLPPAGFDLGNSPAGFDRTRHARHTMFMSTTNGTRAICAAAGSAKMFAGALVNATAAAQAALSASLDVTLLCAGTEGAVALEDLLGAGAVFDAIQQQRSVSSESDKVLIAHRLFESCKSDFASILEQSRGGQNIIAAGLRQDITFAARLDSINVVGEITGNPPTIRAL